LNSKEGDCTVYNITVLDIKSQYIPEVVVVRRGAVGVLGRGRGVGQLGEGVQVGSVYKQPEREEDNSCHIWREPSKWKGIQRGASKGSKGSKGEMRHVYT
jgi:hypothetical protein